MSNSQNPESEFPLTEALAAALRECEPETGYLDVEHGDGSAWGKPTLGIDGWAFKDVLEAALAEVFQKR